MTGPATSSVEGSPGLRAAGFLVTVAGVVLVGVGSMFAWLQVGLEGTIADVISPTYLGADLAEGKLALGLAVVALIAVLIARVGTASSRRWAGVVVLLAGLGIVLASGAIVVNGSDRFAREAVGQLRAAAHGQVDPELLARIESLIQIRLRPGVWLSVAGGIGVAVGGAMTVAWTRRRATPVEGDPSLVGNS